MSDVFISYQREDKAKAQTIAEALEKKGYTVWWDRDILPGGDFENVIKKAINEAKCVIVLWSKKSILSGWVKDEADKGKTRNILIPILIEEVEIPMGFGRIHAARLIEWQGNLSDPEFSLILKSVSELVKTRPTSINVPPVAHLAAVPPLAGLIDNSFLFRWDDIPGKDNQRLVDFLKQTYGIDWARTAKIEKIDDGKTIKVSFEKNSLSFSLNNEKTIANLKIDDGRADDFMVKMENNRLHIEHLPMKPDYYFKLGIAFLEKNDPDQAIHNFDKAIKLDQNQAEYFFQLGKSLLMKDNPDLAIKNFNLAIQVIQLQLNLENPDYYMERGKAYHKINDYDRAIKNHKKAIGLDPNKAVYYFERGRSFSRKEDYENAISDFNRAILLDPGKADYYLEQGMCYQQKADLERAISNFNRAIQIDPNNSHFYLVRGKINMHKGDYDKAIPDFDSAIRLNSKNDVYYYLRGGCFEKKGDYDGAILDYSNAIDHNKNNAEYYFSRGVIFANKEEYDQAILNFNQAIKLDPKKADYYFNLGKSQNNDNDYDEAIKNFNQSIELKSDKAEYYYSRFLSYLFKGIYDKAIEDIKKAIELDPKRKGQLMAHALR